MVGRGASRQLAVGALAAVVVLDLIGAGAAAVAGTQPGAHPRPSAAARPARHAPPRIPAAVAAPSPTPAATAPTPSAAPSALPPVAALVVPDVLVTSNAPLTAAQLGALKTAGATVISVLDAGTVTLGGGTGATLALGVDPADFRRFTPSNTAGAPGLWESVERGDAAVAHAVAAAQQFPLGGIAQINAHPVRVGAFATTAIAGVGVVVDHSRAAELGLVAGAAALVVASGQDPVVTAARITAALAPPTPSPAPRLAGGAPAPATVQVTALRVPVSATGRLQWVAPAVGPITSPFGPRGSLNGMPGGFHEGIDIGAPMSAPIYAAAAGVVQYAGPASGFGNEVILSHPGGVSTVYGHMSVILVRSGQAVGVGQPIALVGAEGDATGPHLHFEVHLGSTPVDPLAWLVAHGVRVER